MVEAELLRFDEPNSPGKEKTLRMQLPASGESCLTSGSIGRRERARSLHRADRCSCPLNHSILSGERSGWLCYAAFMLIPLVHRLGLSDSPRKGHHWLWGAFVAFAKPLWSIFYPPKSEPATGIPKSCHETSSLQTSSLHQSIFMLPSSDYEILMLALSVSET